MNTELRKIIEQEAKDYAKPLAFTEGHTNKDIVRDMDELVYTPAAVYMSIEMGYIAGAEKLYSLMLEEIEKAWDVSSKFTCMLHFGSEEFVPNKEEYLKQYK